VESAVVYDLRTMVHRIEPYQENPLPLVGSLGSVELVRELATLVMIFAVGLLAGRDWRTRLGYSAIVFGLWDILYYVFLEVMCGWPHSLLDWDILFLLPLPWWGPVLAPTLIAVLMILWGGLQTQFAAVRDEGRGKWVPGALAAGGVCLALYVFMKDALEVARGGTEAVRAVLPQVFQWPLFMVALILLSAPIVARARLTGLLNLVPGPRQDWQRQPEAGRSAQRAAQLD
jgi:hypothetical protein